MNIKPSKFTVVDNRDAIEAKTAGCNALQLAATLRNNAFSEV